MAFLYLWVPHLPVQVAMADQTVPIGQALVIVGQPWDDARVLDCTLHAYKAGVEPGQSLTIAQSRCANALFIRADADTYHTIQQTLLEILHQHTPRVETMELGQILAYFAHPHTLQTAEDSERAITQLARQISHEVQQATDLDVRVGTAPQRFTAEQAARAATPRGWAVVLPGEARGFLAPLLLTRLPADPELLRRLHLLGIHTLGELARLPRRAVIHQFDVQAGFFHDLACGKDPRPIHPDAPALLMTRTHTWEPPIQRRSPLETQTSRMLQVLSIKLQRTSTQVQGLRIAIETTEGPPLIEAGAVEPPTADAERLMCRAFTLLARMRPTSGITTLTLTLYPLRPAYLGVTQLALFEAPQATRRQKLQETLRRLRQRFGEFIIQVAALIAPPPPQSIQVVQEPSGMVRTLVWTAHLTRVVHLYEHWRVRRRWWGKPIRRDYYRLETADSRVRIVFHDLETDQWWLERRTR